ncbi:aminotransferase class III-fold pyridoxal phosphate-dependent enzyme [Nocardia sp. NBC_00511]|uniref:aminotransferase class III-fold pyridoxal phosphate-dependent enzyme n=1 Tax=Nocardia sp. NBC_00511 TaxID=2903591 RepID=UPI0030DFE9E6
MRLESPSGPALDGDQRTVRDALTVMVAAKVPNMVLASTYVPPEGAQACYLLHRLLSGADTTGVQWHSVFVNSGVEALGTVLKFVRNKHNRDGGPQPCRILLLDPTTTSRYAYAHAVPGLRDAVDDGLTILTEPAEFLERADEPWTAVIAVRDLLSDNDIDAVDALLATAARHGAVVATGVLRDPKAFRALATRPPAAAAVFLGEVCVEREMPCGTVSFTREAFALWNNPMDCVAHVSTFGGNTVAMRLLNATLRDLRPTAPREDAALERMRRHRLVRRTRLRLHGNTWQTRAIDLAGINMTFEQADGVRYTAGGRQYVDVASGAGPAFRGHNTRSPESISRLSADSDAIEQLTATLGRLTGLPVMAPAVSGASAVDLAVLAALGARPGRHTVVTLRGNYSGKGALSLMMSRTSDHFRDRDQHAFAPYPARIIDVALDDPTGLREALRRDDVALVWLEPVQGLECVPIPQRVLDEIDCHRAQSGYLVGFDEVLTGFWRADPNHFVVGAGTTLRPDIVALSKAMSDALLPMGAVMMSHDVHADLARRAPDLAHWILTHYRNPLGAALAVDALNSGEDHPASDRAAVAAALDDVFAAAAQSPVFAGGRRSGLLGRLLLSPATVGASPRPDMLDHVDATITRMAAQQCGVITLQLRVMPCTAGHDTAVVVDALARLAEFLRGLGRFAVYRTMATAALACACQEAAATAIGVRERFTDRRRLP